MQFSSVNLPYSSRTAHLHHILFNFISHFPRVHALYDYYSDRIQILPNSKDYLIIKYNIFQIQSPKTQKIRLRTLVEIVQNENFKLEVIKEENFNVNWSVLQPEPNCMLVAYVYDTHIHTNEMKNTIYFQLTELLLLIQHSTPHKVL